MGRCSDISHARHLVRIYVQQKEIDMTVLQRGSKGNDVKVLQRCLNLYEDGIFGQITEDAVKRYQRQHNLRVDGIVGLATWDSLSVQPWEAPASVAIVPSKRKITEIIVHCSATPEGRHHTVEDIRKWHKAQGWSDVGYHYVVYLDGSIHYGRDVNIIGAHCSNHNAHSIGVCYVGGVAADGKTAKDTRTWQQKESLTFLLKELKRQYPTAKIYGHHDFDKRKACPSFDAKKEYQEI